jgi:hypothetical protein
MSDRRDSFVQSYLKALSYKIYRDTTVGPKISPITDEIWDTLENPDFPQEALPDLETLNFFEHDQGWVNRNINIVVKTQGVISRIVLGEDPGIEDGPLLRPTRYRKGLPGMTPGQLEGINHWLREYLSACASTH